MKIEEILDNLVETIKASSIYQNYDHILKQVEKNIDIKDTVNEIKALQKKLVKEQYTKGEKVGIIKKELEKTTAFLNDIPLYQDYIEASEEVNDLLKQVSNRLQSYLDGLDI